MLVAVVVKGVADVEVVCTEDDPTEGVLVGFIEDVGEEVSEKDASAVDDV